MSGRQVHVALGTVANKQGRVAGINLGGGYARFPGVVGTAITKVCALEVARTGLTEREAAAAGFEVRRHDGRVHDLRRLPARPAVDGAQDAGRAEHRAGSSGAQIVGGAGAGKRIDTVATALHARMRVDEVVDLDLAYAPPMATTWDPVALAARRLVEEIRGQGRQ